MRFSRMFFVVLFSGDSNSNFWGGRSEYTVLTVPGNNEASRFIRDFDMGDAFFESAKKTSDAPIVTSR